MKWTRAAPAKHDCLPARFIDDTIAFQTTRNADRFTLCRIRRDQFRTGPRAESLRARNGIGRNELDHTQSIFTISYERELRCIYAANLHGACVVQRAAGIEHLIDERPLWILNVDNVQSARRRHVKPMPRRSDERRAC